MTAWPHSWPDPGLLAPAPSRPTPTERLRRVLLGLALLWPRRAGSIHLAEQLATAVPAETDEERADLLATLYEVEARELVRLARLFTDDRNAAEDLVQEAFIRLYHAAHRIEDPDKAVPYLRSIVLNLARDHNRRGLMSLRHHEAMTPEVAPDSPADQLELNEEQAAIIRAVRALSPQQRNCLVLRFYLDLSESEIAETLGISPNSVKTHTRRGLEQLRMRLDERATDGPSEALDAGGERGGSP